MLKIGSQVKWSNRAGHYDLGIVTDKGQDCFGQTLVYVYVTDSLTPERIGSQLTFFINELEESEDGK